ncbi:MAG: DUF1553 domain-containing protein, partial [Planctomycetales bacterium]
APQALATDPDNRLLWSYPVRRLESEAVRDSLLAVAGALDGRLMGPPTGFLTTPDGQVVGQTDQPGQTSFGSRRSLYLRQRRSEPVTFLQTFDLAAPEPNCLRRSSSTVVGQALALLNNPFAVHMADRFAARVAAESVHNLDARILRAYQIALGRPADEEETAQLREFLTTQQVRYRQAGLTDDESLAAALVDLCQALLASNEFLYIP